LRGGRLPFSGGPLDVMSGHVGGTPDLTMLPEEERPVVARALEKEPERRWPSCVGFAAALERCGVPATVGVGAGAPPLPAPPAPSRPSKPLSDPALQMTSRGSAGSDTLTQGRAPSGRTAPVPQPTPVGPRGLARFVGVVLAGALVLSLAVFVVVAAVSRSGEPERKPAAPEPPAPPAASGPTAGTSKVAEKTPKDTSKVVEGTSKGRVTQEAPKGSLELTAPDLVEVRAGTRYDKMKVTLTRVNVTGPVKLSAAEPPAGLRFDEVTFKEGDREALVAIEVKAGVRDGVYPVTLVAVAGTVEAKWLVKVRVPPRPPPLKLNDMRMLSPEQMAQLAVPVALEGFAEAVPAAEVAMLLAGEPDWAKVAYDRGTAALEERNYEEAVRVCDLALVLAPDNAEVRLCRGRACYELHRHEEAVCDLKIYLNKCPNHEGAKKMCDDARRAVQAKTVVELPNPNKGTEVPRINQVMQDRQPRPPVNIVRPPERTERIPVRQPERTPRRRP
jgi:hypothetical protein